MIKRVVIIILLLKCMFYVLDAIPAAASRSGPFQSSIVNAAVCEKWTQPIDKHPSVFLNVEIYNTSTKTNLLRGNVTILRDCKNAKIKAKGFYWEGGKWKLVYLINNMGCNSIFMPVITFMTGVKYDHKNCIVFKGKYSFDNLDANITQHMLAPVQEYGRIKWRNEFISRAGTAFCWEFETLVVPLNITN